MLELVSASCSEDCQMEAVCRASLGGAAEDAVGGKKVQEVCWSVGHAR